MPTVYVWPGRTTQNSCWVRAKVTGASVRLAVSTSTSMANPVYFGPAVPTADGIVSIEATNLTVDTKYSFALEIDSVIDTNVIGAFRTHPTLGEPADFTIAAFSCAGSSPTTPGTGAVLAASRLSNSASFLDVLNRNPLQLVHLGDLAYYDPGSGVYVADASLATFRRMVDDVFIQPNQHELYRNVSTQYAVDDHDGGPNNHNGQFEFIHNARAMYRERVPHYDLNVPNSNYQKWSIGRIGFMLLDSRNGRSPNTDAPSPDKTMLGPGQKHAIEQDLEHSTDELMVIYSPSAWHNPDGDDGWETFTHDRQWLIDTIALHGWTGRVLIVNGDIHALAIDSGANSPGGIPVLQAASMDSAFGAVQSQYDRGPSKPGRSQYGTVRFNDLGGRIDVTLTGWENDAVWREYTYSVTVDDDTVPTPDVIPAFVPARKQKTVTWLGCDVHTGRIIAELPDMTGAFGRRLGTYTSSSLSVPIPTGDSSKVEILRGATTPGHTMAVAVVNSRPVWGGLILSREAGTEPTLSVGAVSLEGYYDRRRIRDHSWTGKDAASVILTTLFRDAGSIGGVGRGLGILVDAPPSGILLDREYKAVDRKTIYSGVREVMADGPEWTVDLEWTNVQQNAVAKISRVRSRIGIQARNPNTVFSTTAGSVFDTRGGSEATYTFREDYSDGHGANYIIAYSTGEGDDQPVSVPAIGANLDSGWPIFEDHFQPASGLNAAQVEPHATARLALRQDGARTFKIQARWDATPSLGADWNLGDDVGWHLYGHWHPTGILGQGRAIGYNVNPEAGIVDLILWTPEEDI